MAIVSCGYCGHPGAHAEALPSTDGRTRCGDCPICKRELALERLRTTQPEELDTPGHREALITDARMAGADLEQISEALETPR